ncbi:unnamed protein product [Durusdinium trenchii]|uniref:Uncharacterized protein n=1 Tax=Durusdinium trenchii TaxID=1381693 RepID=A0ABP0L4P7_9DINO
MAAASRPNLEKATWLGHVQRLRELLDEECSEVQRSLSEHTCGNQWDAEMDKNEIPCQKEEANDASDANSNVCSAMSELQSAWKGGEANEVVALIQSALALVGVYEKNASRSACGKANEDVDGLKAAATAELAAIEQKVEEARKVAQRREEEKKPSVKSLYLGLSLAMVSTDIESPHFGNFNGISAAQIRLGFIRKVYGIVCAQVTATALFAALCCGPLQHPVTSFVMHWPSTFRWGSLIATGLSLFLCYTGKNSFPMNFYGLCLLTAVMACDVGAVIFCAYLVFDTWRIANELEVDDYVEGAVQLYMDIINLSCGKGSKPKKKHGRKDVRTSDHGHCEWRAFRICAKMPTGSRVQSHV